MNGFAHWCGFLGAWLLFAGPIFQAETELDAEAREAAEIRPVMESARPREPEPSRWWWLLPPVGYALQRRWARGMRDRVLAALTPEQTAQVVRLNEKALGWQIVAGGAFLIALDETWLLVRAHGWSTLAFWLIVAAMVVVTVGFVAMRSQRRYDILDLERPHRSRPERSG